MRTDGSPINFALGTGSLVMKLFLNESIIKNIVEIEWITSRLAQLSQRDPETHELLPFAKLRSGIFEPPFGGLRGKVGALSIPPLESA